MKPRLEVPAELRTMAERAIDQSEKAFEMYLAAASNWLGAMPTPTSDVSKKSLSFAEQNVKAAFDHARKLVHASDPQEAIQLQSEFLKSQMTAARAQMEEIAEAVSSAGKEATEGKFRLGGST